MSDNTNFMSDNPDFMSENIYFMSLFVTKKGGSMTPK